jgi:DNA segregation ATPase FtsK/SpoIIIE-like protein
MEPTIVPPSWDKSIYSSALQRIWEQAFEYLKEAAHWVFVGTSLPMTDRYLEHLFAIALRHNFRLRRITIVDPGEARKIHRLFENSASRVQVDHLRQDMATAFGIGGSPSMLFKKLHCFAPAKDRAFAW